MFLLTSDWLNEATNGHRT